MRAAKELFFFCEGSTCTYGIECKECLTYINLLCIADIICRKLFAEFNYK